MDLLWLLFLPVPGAPSIRSFIANGWETSNPIRCNLTLLMEDTP
jgi:hypothetical protein